ncbi:sulfate reduction electron transfer complex DsrMKJOP subunit DsrM [Megalodesulfovibrio gigas]|uniref:Putative hdr-like menaquinol oxidoreductase cytochrome b-like subunit n=2 Tax=Megalodesulfovibrio gigas TaxID=879 RepID=T2GDX8_MEGG1|nr:sulfate reduction electron transfer complex DsrMKJOP subunit DsrM [Megalodesulfovibrio gigas]AGS82788.1 putative hdr-like menaquinol oxidoreductase cytochrome b-like subunit [Megalodesulfovibrio gigas]AGW14087.1 putative hdr-like menaquinol oxidoreductase cytochrome b-like subunit [Megalodesulfovibrio gigas DSM 1382 = ATCC 19364]
MAFFISLILVLTLCAASYYGAEAGMQWLFGMTIPYLAIAGFVCGFAYKIYSWAKSPVPFRIPTTGGQQYSHEWIKHNPLDNPHTVSWTVGRMLLEILTFRSLFRNTEVVIHRTEDGPRVAYNSARWLWLFGLIFHYCFLVIFLRHFRFFLDPVPFFVRALEFTDGIFQIGAPRLYQTDVLILAALAFLLLRRMFDHKVRYISLISDYFPLVLISGIALSGIYMRYLGKTDINAVKIYVMGLFTLSPVSAEGIAPIFFMHLFLVCALLLYFPWSKLMHLGGVFLSPTRNLPNDSRMRMHVNPWNPPKKYHTYEAYEDDFREFMVEAGLPVDKPLDKADA